MSSNGSWSEAPIAVGARRRFTAGTAITFLMFLTFLLSISFISIALISGCDVKLSSGGDKQASAEEKKKAGGVEPAVLVEVAALERGRIVDSITLSGDLISEHALDLTSRVSARVAEAPVRAGDQVLKDQLILKLEDEELEILARQDEYSFKEAQEKARSAGLERTEAQKNERLKHIVAEKAAKEYARIEELVGSGPTDALSQEEIENKLFAREEAKLGSDMAGLATERSDIAAKLAKIAVDQAKARWDRSLLEVKRCEIRSPIDGAVSMLDVRPGEMVQAGTVVAEVVNTRERYTEVGVPQRRLASLRLGQKVEITAETCPGQLFEGVLAAIYPTVDPREGSVKVRISVVDLEKILRPGIYVSASESDTRGTRQRWRVRVRALRF